MILIYILITLLILGVLIVAHEFGHYVAARRLGIGVTEFSIGMGPALYQRDGKHTRFSLRALPLGGYCALEGEQETAETAQLLTGTAPVSPPAKRADAFSERPARQRLIVLAAGVVVNFVLGYAILYVACLVAGTGPFAAFGRAGQLFVLYAGLIFTSLKMLITGAAGVSDMTGPVGMVQIVGELYAYGPVSLMLFSAMLSINLGIMNLIPIPALDGGQIVLTGIEAVKKGPISARLRSALFALSYAALLVLTAVVLYSDVMRAIGA